jgi:hypothetical protein
MSALLELYESTPPDVRRRGRRWYPAARRRLDELARSYERPFSQVAAVFAIVSPAAQLKSCLRWTEEILRGERMGGRYPNMQGPKIERALSTRYPVRHATGPKVSAFYRALMGDTQAVVIDRWSARAAGWDSAKHAIPRTVQRELEQAYREAAAEVGERVREFQAITWLALRETQPKAVNGRIVVPKLWDVTDSQISEKGGSDGDPRRG